MKKILALSLLSFCLIFALFSCGKINGSNTQTACTHDYEASTVKPTCTENGYTKYTCKSCGHSYNNDITPATGHRFFERYCVYCEMEEPFLEIEHDISWYDQSKFDFDIGTKEQLAGLAYLVNTGTDNFANKTIILTASIDLLSQEWIPIGTEENPFAGIFNGRGFTISNLKLNKDSSLVGLFGYSLGEISNIDLQNASVSVTGFRQYVGIACGFSTKPIYGITVSGYVSAPECNYVGGVVGKIDHVIKNCTSSAEIHGRTFVAGIAGYVLISDSHEFTELHNSGAISGHDQVAGIIGRFYGLTNSSSHYIYKFNNLSNSGNIQSGNHAGGIIAWADTENTHSAGTTTVQASVLNNTGNVISGGWKVGGIFGVMNTEQGSYLINSSSSAEIKGTSYVGGLVGQTGSLSIQNSTNEGSRVSATGFAPDGGDPYVFLGGYVGYGFQVTGCTNNADITYNGSGWCVGGIAGHICGQISYCANNGTIISNGNDVGGIAGRINNIGRQICWNNGLTNTGDIKGKDNVGGIIGHTIRCEDNNNNNHSVIYFNFNTNTGRVTGNTAVGGIGGRFTLEDPGNYSQMMFATDFNNSGNISGNSTVGEFFGVFYNPDYTSTIKIYTSLGQIVLNGETLVGNYLVGQLTGLSITKE